MAKKGPKYHRFNQLGRPSPKDYIDKVVVNSNKKVSTKKYKCKECGKEFFYKPNECTNCFSKEIVKADD